MLLSEFYSLFFSYLIDHTILKLKMLLFFIALLIIAWKLDTFGYVTKAYRFYYICRFQHFKHDSLQETFTKTQILSPLPLNFFFPLNLWKSCDFILSFCL